jgi:hypothetical protein
VALAGRQHPDDRPAGAAWSRSRPGRGRAPGRRPFLAPAAWGWARTVVPSTKCSVQSSSPARPQRPVPDAGPLPAAEAGVHGLPLAVPLRQVAPGGAGLQAPEDAVDDRLVVQVRLADRRLLRRQVRLQLVPLLVGQFVSPYHPPRLPPLCKQALEGDFSGKWAFLEHYGRVFAELEGSVELWRRSTTCCSGRSTSSLWSRSGQCAGSET